MLRLKIEGNWEPEDFIEVLQATESLYYKALPRRHRPYYPELLLFERRTPFSSYDDQLNYLNDWILKEARMTAYGQQRLMVSRIEYASPGGIDLVGIGKALEAVDKIVGRLIDFYADRNLRKERDKQAALDTQIKEVELEKERESLRSMQIENARELLRIEREYPRELEELLLPLAVRDQEKLTSRIADQKLIGVRREDGDGKGRD